MAHSNLTRRDREGDYISYKSAPLPVVSELAIPLERDEFLRTLLRHLAGALQKVVSLEAASGFVSVVGQEIGDEINHIYNNALAVENLSREQVGEVLVDLKRRIQGDFLVVCLRRMDGRRAVLDHLVVLPIRRSVCERIDRRIILEDKQRGSEGRFDSGYNWYGDWGISLLRLPPT